MKKHNNIHNMLIRRPNDFMFEGIERSIHDSIYVMKRTLESGYVFPGSGCVEITLVLHLENFAKTLYTKE